MPWAYGGDNTRRSWVNAGADDDPDRLSLRVHCPSCQNDNERLVSSALFVKVGLGLPSMMLELCDRD